MAAPVCHCPIRRVLSIGLGLAVAAVAGMVLAGWKWEAVVADTQPSLEMPISAKPADREKLDAPELDGGIAWINTSGPLKMADLKGKVVLLDFWTLCCINCIHVMPDLAKLEKKYPNELVVIGVHSAKFDNEKETKSIRQAVLRYELKHPVVNDANHAIWNRYQVTSWPTIALLDPEGHFYGRVSGEGNFDVLDDHIGRMIKKAKENKTLDEKPIRFDLLRYRTTADTPLFFPGKILADAAGDRLFIADSTHHRIVVTSLSGEKKAIIGSGTPGLKNGPAKTAQFDDPQGMALDGKMLYVADRKNHCLRAIDLNSQQVSTLAGTGQQDGDYQNRKLDHAVPAASTGLNSPWDLLLIGRELYIAMAGHHQIWAMNLDAKTLRPFAGSGRENLEDGPRDRANFAQPSGLATDGQNLYVADSEVSAIRRVPLGDDLKVSTLVGEGLFEFGDADGIGNQVRLQHALGLSFTDGKLLVADTYNSKLKWLDAKTRTCTTFLGGRGTFWTGPLFNEPAGLSIANGKAYVADTNAHRVRVVDLKTKAVTTLDLKGVEPPPPQAEWQPPKK